VEKFSVIFLGERRISQGALKVLLSDEFKNDFRLRAIVTNPKFHSMAQGQLGLSDSVRFISNELRNTAIVEDVIDAYGITLLLSVQHIWVLPASVLRAVNGLAFNLHNSALPEYKGYNSISHAIIDGVKEFRTTIHWMADAVDSGDIAFQGIVPVSSAETALSLYSKSIVVAVASFRDLLRSLVGGQVPRVPMIGEGVFYRRRDLECLKDLSGQQNPETIDRVARAAYFPPLPPAFRMINGNKFYLIPADDYERIVSGVVTANQPTP